MVLVASAVHLPIYYIPLIFAVDAFLDMFRTSTNILGDSIGAIVVDRMIPEDSPDSAPGVGFPHPDEEDEVELASVVLKDAGAFAWEAGAFANGSTTPWSNKHRLNVAKQP